jgi:hypothetical protein
MFDLDAVDVRYAARVNGGALATIHRHPEYRSLLSVAVGAETRFLIVPDDCRLIADATARALEQGQAAIELSNGAGFYLYRNLSYIPEVKAFRLCIGSPLRRTLYESGLRALGMVTARWARDAESGVAPW